MSEPSSRWYRAPGLALWLLPAVVLLFGTLVSWVDVVGVGQTREALPTAEVATNPESVPMHVRRFEALVPQRVAIIASGFGIAVSAHVVFAWFAHRVRRQRPAAVLLLTGILAAGYLVLLAWLNTQNPVLTYGKTLEEGPLPPWDMSSVSPSWYLSCRVWFLLLAGVAYLIVIVLLTRTTSVAGTLAGREWAARTLAVTPAWTVVYLAIQSAGLAGAREPSGGELALHGVGDEVSSFIGFLLVFILGASLLPLAFALAVRRRPWPVLLIMLGGACLIFAMIFWFVARNSLLDFPDGVLPDDQGSIMLEPRIPGWHEPIMLALGPLAALHQLIGLIALARGIDNKDPARAS